MAVVPEEMTCLLKEKENEGYTLLTRPVPVPGPADVIIKVDRVSICGSDINLWKWNDVARVIATVPFIPGHEATGEVVAVGSGVTEVKLGQRVAVENHYYCGTCYQCKEGRGDICQRLSQYGHGRGTDQGGCCQYSCVPARFCYVWRTMQWRISVWLGRTCWCWAVDLWDWAREVYGVDVDPERLSLALQMGATEVINGAKENITSVVMNLSNKNGVGRIVEASGAASLLNQSFSWLRKGGQMVLIGLPKEPLHVENVLTDVVFKSLTLKTVHGRRIFHTWEECERLLADGLVNVGPVVSHRLPMTQYLHAFNLLMTGAACKIILDPQH
ncbi:L-threonine 3-dehydrogenase-like 2 [Homarus americanus]|uniref:L-threonine 3-dehydrogenase-like 2 n=1 Tax=Homarus americanus TaxID=6706 RepID=A0A8J5MUL5_HOMAM|nr:L-threonine 3-dehydrogenase-like 2 [Homarus americanus]